MAGYRIGNRDARVEHRGSYSAWLMKEDGDEARWFQPSCRRYFTIDFDDRVIFYSHSELDKYIADPIPFKEILWASLVEVDTNANLVKQQRPVFVVETCHRPIRLVSESEHDAKLWVDALNAARLIGQQADTSCKVGLFRSSWDLRAAPGSAASMSTADGSVSTSSRRTTFSDDIEFIDVDTGSARCALRAMRAASPSESTLDRCLSDSAEVDAELLDILLNELQDDIDLDEAEDTLDSFDGPAWRCDSPELEDSIEEDAIDLDVLEYMLHSLDVKPAVSVKSHADNGAEDMWAAPGRLHLLVARAGVI